MLALSSFLAENHCVLPAPRDPSSSQRLQVLANLPQRRPQTRQFRHTTADAQRRWWLDTRAHTDTRLKVLEAWMEPVPGPDTEGSRGGAPAPGASSPPARLSGPESAN